MYKSSLYDKESSDELINQNRYQSLKYANTSHSNEDKKYHNENYSNERKLDDFNELMKKEDYKKSNFEVTEKKIEDLKDEQSIQFKAAKELFTDNLMNKRELVGADKELKTDAKTIEETINMAIKDQKLIEEV